MTPLSEKKDVQVIKYDMCVIVDNSVEIGDFFLSDVFLSENIYLFSVKNCRGTAS